MTSTANSAAQASYEKGIKHYDEDDFDTAVTEFTEVIRLDPNNADAYVASGDVYKKLGRSDEAVRDYETALSLDPKNKGAKKALQEIRGNQGR